MKRITIVIICIMLLITQLIFAQKESGNLASDKQNKSIYLETGINLSLPVHIEMYRSHRLAIGINARVAKPISKKTDIGVRIEYDYRFIKKNSRNITAESTLKERALHSNFSLICIKPNVQFNLNSNWFWGAESGLGYAISDEDSKIGLGFVSEYNDTQQFGLCSGLYLGKYFIIGSEKNKLGISLNLTQFLANWHAENSLGLKFNYRFN